MKKAILIPAFILTFVIGVAVSDFILQGINSLLGKDVFVTKNQLQKKIEETQMQSEETEKKMAELKGKYDDLSAETSRKQADLNSLMKEVETKVNAGVIQDLLLKTPSADTGQRGKIFLDASGGETLLEPTTTDDPTISQFKETFNKKAKDIIDVAKGVLKNKVGEFNSELVRVNTELEDRNLELIGKLKEVEKLNKEVDRVNVELKEKNTQLEAKLNEVEKYKNDLEQQQKYIDDLEGVKKNLERTVGSLEAKIENGRLKVSFKGDILFESGSHQLRTEGQRLLDTVYPILKENIRHNDIFIAGHTDNVPIRADARDKYESNWTLSTYRATEVVKYLVGKGIPPQSLTAAGYGEYNPIADNAGDEGKSKNRRVELFLIPKIIKRSSN